jgi:hypothetical protein
MEFVRAVDQGVANMTREELLSCMREAAEALAEFRHLLPEHSREANDQVIEAREHFANAIAILETRGFGGRLMRLVD